MSLIYTAYQTPLEALIHNTHSTSKLCEMTGLDPNVVPSMLSKTSLLPTDTGYHEVTLAINSHKQFKDVDDNLISPALFAALPSILYIEKYVRIVELINIVYSPISSHKVAFDSLNETCRILSCLANVGVSLPTNPIDIDDEALKNLDKRSATQRMDTFKNIARSAFGPHFILITKLVTAINVAEEWVTTFHSDEDLNSHHHDMELLWENVSATYPYQALHLLHPQSLNQLAKYNGDINFHYIATKASELITTLTEISSFQRKFQTAKTDYFAPCLLKPLHLLKVIKDFKTSKNPY